MNKKLSIAQQILVAAIAGKTLTYRIVRNVGGASRSIFDAKIDGKKPDFRIALATIEALINSGHVILKSVNIYGNIHTVILPCDNHATVPAQGETFAALQKDNEERLAERKEIEMRNRTAGYTVESDRRLTVIDKERWELYRKAAYILMTTAPDGIDDAKFAHHVVDIAALTAKSKAERDFWNDQKAWWGKEIKARREAPEAAAPEAEVPEAKVATAEVEAPEAPEAQVATAAPAPTTPAPTPEATEVSDAEILAENEAIARYLIATSTDDSVHRHTLGTVLLAQGKKDEARQVFLALYESYRHDNRLQEAKQPLWEIIMNFPDYAAIAYTLLGKLCEELEQYPYAIVVYTYANNCIGVNEDCLYGLHRACLAMGKEAKAQEYLEQARVLADEREIAMGRCIPVPTQETPEAKAATEATETSMCYQDERHKGE